MIKTSIQYGVVIGLILSAISAIVYFVSWESMASMSLGLLIMLLIIVLPILAAIRVKKQTSPFALKEAFITTFVICLGAVIVSSAYNYVMYGLVDPGFGERLAEVAVANQEEMMMSFGLEGEELETQLEAAYEQVKNQYSPGGILTGIIWSALLSAVFSIIVALIIRRKEEPTEPILDQE